MIIILNGDILIFSLTLKLDRFRTLQIIFQNQRKQLASFSTVIFQNNVKEGTF